MRHGKIRENELKELCRISMFNKDLVKTFYEYFRKFSNINKEDGVIDYPEFLEMINQNDNSFSKNLFCTFDQNCNSNINFREFIKFYSVFQNGNSASKTKLTFKMFSGNLSKFIDKQQVTNILSDGVKANETLSKYITKTEIDNIVKNSFEKYNLILKNDYKNHFFKKLNCQETDEFEENNNRISNTDLNHYNKNSINSTFDFEGIINEDRFNFDNFSIIFNHVSSITSWMCINTDKLKSLTKGYGPCGSCF